MYKDNEKNILFQDRGSAKFYVKTQIGM
jgi:hypothetical protein